METIITGYRLPGLFGTFGVKVWTLGPKVWDPIMRVQEP